MILNLGQSQATTVLEAMKTVIDSGSAGLTAIDHENLRAAGEIALGLHDVDTDALGTCSPAELGAAVGRGPDGVVATRMLAVGSIVGGLLEPRKMDCLRSFAGDLRVDEEYLEILEDASAGRVGAATDRLTERNAESFLGYEGNATDHDPAAEVMPFGDGGGDRGMELDYSELGELPKGTFGRAFFEHFVSNGLDFPGNENGQIEGFALTHDSCHLLSGYPTDEPGELLVSTFIAAMHDRKPMESQILPAIFSWHLGIRMNWLVGRHEGAFEPWTFWDAWDRGAKTRADVFDPGWDFWAAVHQDLTEIRREFGVPPARAVLAA